VSSQGKIEGSQPKIVSSQGKIEGSQPKIVPSQGKIEGSQPKIVPSQAKIEASQPKIVSRPLQNKARVNFLVFLLKIFSFISSKMFFYRFLLILLL